ncbi:AtpZ/AtpI family protein [Candidatus Parcubacteria bacterium]|nr:AtpZ/AtpI family protein [Candidatus Parcubacteria bacterium]
MEENKNSNKKDLFEIAYAIGLITKIGVVVSVISVSFIYFGYYLDKQLDRYPIFVITGAVISFALSMVAVYRLVLPIANKDEK